jgi:hypothetical protein
MLDLLITGDMDQQVNVLKTLPEYQPGHDVEQQLIKVIKEGNQDIALRLKALDTLYTLFGDGEIERSLVNSILTAASKHESNEISIRAQILSDEVTYPRQMEKIGRGLIAVKVDNGVYIGWRLLGTDPEDISFNIYRDGILVNDAPIESSTNYLDGLGTVDSTYYVCPVVEGKEQPNSEVVRVWQENYLSIPLQKPEGGKTPDGVSYTYIAAESSVGDLDGDGEYEVVLKWEPSNARDNAHDGYTGEVFIDAYKLDGTQMWRIGLGRNIRAGNHYTQLMVYDLDGDGKAEIALKTADGVTDGEGKVIGDPDADYRNSRGRVLAGPEFLTIFEGTTGKELVTADYIPPRGNVSDWGDDYGNRVDRFLACIAYLDGERPSLVMCRGYYTRTVLVAYNWRDGKLEKLWTFDSDEPGNSGYAGQGNHQVNVADVDNDGKDEIIYGACVIDHDGTGLYTTGLGHGDAIHTGNLDPDRAGLEVFIAHEEYPNPAGIEMHDAGTGEILWGIPIDYDVGRAVAGDIDPRYRGFEVWVPGSKGGLFSCRGKKISDNMPAHSKHRFAIWWDGDLLKEILYVGENKTEIVKWDYESETTKTIFTAEGATLYVLDPNLQVDLFGDWREELVLRSVDSTELRIYTTTAVTNHRIYTLMHDPVYRLGIAWQNVAYNLQPHTSFYLGDGMEKPSKPNIYVV